MTEPIHSVGCPIWHTGGPSVENLGNVLGNRTQAWSHHLKKINHQTSSVSLGTGQKEVRCSAVGEVHNKYSVDLSVSVCELLVTGAVACGGCTSITGTRWLTVRTVRWKVNLHWRANLMTFFTFVAPLAVIGLVRWNMENAWDCCVAENISEKTWWLHAPALLLLVLPQKSNMLPDLSASV